MKTLTLPKIKGKNVEINAVRLSYEKLLKDPLKHKKTGAPWAFEFVNERVKVIECVRNTDYFGWYRGNGVVWLDLCMDDDDHSYARIASVLVHEANHGYWNYNFHKCVEGEEKDCIVEQAKFLERIRASKESVQWAWAKLKRCKS